MTLGEETITADCTAQVWFKNGDASIQVVLGKVDDVWKVANRNVSMRVHHNACRVPRRGYEDLPVSRRGEEEDAGKDPNAKFF